ncbi:Xaa-His dipeptidase [Clostridium thailandense]|uniref:Xaa-His dipeptidase n=1 Tax=Clostridium thailandense TaxID=2794346 RepID=UPI003989FDD3
MQSNEDIIKDNLELIGTMVEDNKTDKEISKKLGIGYSTYRKYKAQNEELKQVIAEGKDKKNQEVEQALYKCCVGYSYYEDVATKTKVQRIENGVTLESEEVVISSVKKYRGPDLSAQKYWLNNKQKTKWSEDPNKTMNDKKLTKLKEKEVEAKTSPI